MTFTPKYSPAFRYWELALAGRADLFGPEDPLMTGKPQIGYYKAKLRDGSWEPVAILPNPLASGGLVEAIRGKHRVIVPAIDAWTYCGANPVSYEAYKQAYETGKFPGEIDLPGIGHNSGGDESAEIRDRLNAVCGQASKVIIGLGFEISASQADELANYRDAINKAWKEADAVRKQNCEAWAKAQKAENDLWKPSFEVAEECTAAIKRLLKPFLEKEPGRKIGGQFSKRASLRSKWVAEITDWEAFAAYCSGHPRVREELQKCANAEARGGREQMPGVIFRETKTVT